MKITANFTEISNEDFVSLLYGLMLGRAPEQSGIDYWTGKVSEMGQQWVFTFFAGCEEATRKWGGKASFAFEGEVVTPTPEPIPPAPPTPVNIPAPQKMIPLPPNTWDVVEGGSTRVYGINVPAQVSILKFECYGANDTLAHLTHWYEPGGWEIPVVARDILGTGSAAAMRLSSPVSGLHVLVIEAEHQSMLKPQVEFII